MRVTCAELQLPLIQIARLMPYGPVSLLSRLRKVAFQILMALLQKLSIASEFKLLGSLY